VPFRVAALALALAVVLAPAAPQAPTHSGVIVVSLLERTIGRETYTLTPVGRGFEFSSEMDLVERGGPLHVESAMQLDSSFAPLRFRASGRSYRFVNVDVDVEVSGASARVRNLADTRDVQLPEHYFTAQSYAPLAARALLVRYWESHGRPARIDVLPGSPSRPVTVEFRGEDVVRVAGRDARLRRYTVSGVVWGRESVWIDDRDQFAAITSRIHIMALEGVREDLVDAWPALQASDIRDRMADLAGLAEVQARGAVATGAYALAGGRVVDGLGGAPIEDAIVVVEHGVITAVGPRASVTVPAGARTIDATGTTITPGLWDLHGHVSQIEWAPAYLAAGVTSVRDMGGEAAFLTAFRDALAAGRAVGPRLLLAGLVDADSDRALGAVAASTPEAGRAVVDRYHAMGFDQMKLYSLLEPDVVRAITARAHELGMTVTGHVPTSLGLAGAIDAGMDQVAHMPGGSADLIDTLVARGVAIDPTLPWGELLGHAPETPIEAFEPGIASIDPALEMNYRSVTTRSTAASVAAGQQRTLALVKRLHDAGVPIVAGTDGAVPGYSLLRNLELFVAAGLTPMEAIQAATVVPARVMGLAGSAGTIEVGKRADLLVLDANPLDDIANIRRARWVASNGVLYDVRAFRAR
jgi:imidazolonepropionase-like amidohydrolase